ncbi:MAG: cob(I)yrinic acid a,c-diamide adenosyltransferase [Clostridium sp.]
MDKGKVQVICGGCGKSSMALGKGILALTQHKKVIMIQFLKGSLSSDSAETMKRLEPDMKVFRFEKLGDYFEKLTDKQKHEEELNIFNGINFAKKVLTTGECDVLILDEILGILDQQIITSADLENLLSFREEDVDLILTGKVFPKELADHVDSIAFIDNLEVDKEAK